MEFSGMNKTSEETLSYLSSSATAHPSIYKTLRYSPSNEFIEKGLSHVSPEDQVLRLVDAFHCPFSNDLRECESPQIPMVSAMCNRLVPSDILSGFADRSSEFDQPKVSSNSEKSSVSEVDGTGCLLKSDLREKSYPCVVSKLATNPHSPSSNLVPDGVCIHSPCNGSLSRPESNSDGSSQVDKPEIIRDINGCCRRTDVSPSHDHERAKMDLDKLDETIDYVLSVARSDEPCEGMFVLSCRARESTVTSSPNPRANTPSSELINSPTISPAPSPHSNNLSSPVLQTCKTQTVFQSNTSCNIVSPQPMQRYIVDQTHGIIQLSSNPSQCVSAHYGNQGVSFVQLCPDSSSNPVFQVSQHHLVSQISQPLAANTHVLFHPSMLHSFPNHAGPQAQFPIPHSTLPTASVQRISTPILSPVRTSVLQTVTNHVARTSDANIASYPVSSHILEGTNPHVSNQAISTNHSNVCIVQTPVPSPQPLLRSTVSTPVSLETSDDVTYSLSVSANTTDLSCTQLNTAVTFRHPIIPVNTTSMPPTSVCVLPNYSLTSAHSHVTCPQSITSMPRKRSHTSTSGNNKRRKTLGSPSYPAVSVTNKNLSIHEVSVHPLHSGAQEHMDKLKSVDLKSLVSAPTLQPFFSVLPPTGMDESLSSGGSEEVFLHRHGLKYSRGRMSLKFPKCIDSTTSREVVDSYLTQHLKVVLPAGPVLCPPRNLKRSYIERQSICASPEPPSFETNMKTLFSRMNLFAKKYSKDVYDEIKVGYDSCKLSNETLIPQSLLHMFSKNPSNSLEKNETDRCTPPLALYHMPNPRLLCQPIHLAPCVGKRLDSQLNEVDSSNVSTLKAEHDLQGLNSYKNVVDESPISVDLNPCIPFVDSETGETTITQSKSFKTSLDPTLTENDKLHITFTVNPSTTVNISKIIHRISEILGVEENSIDCQITRSGAQITLDQKQSQSEVVMRNLETHLKQQFTPLSLQFEKNLGDYFSRGIDNSNHIQSATVDNTPRTKHLSSNTSQVISCRLECDVISKTDYNPASTLENGRYSEEPVSISSILASKSRSTKLCKKCGKPVSPYMTQRKWLDELSSISGISVSLDNAVDFLFCSINCLYGFAHLLSYRNKCSESSLNYSSQTDMLNVGNCCSLDQRRQLVMTDFPCSMPILLQSSLSKSKPNLKRQYPQQCTTTKKRATNTAILSKFRKWQGIRWRSYVGDTHHSLALSSRRNAIDDVPCPFGSNPAVMHAPHSDDKRVCDLCQQAGDAPEDGPGRLLPLDLDSWIHINCALWCYEVYETVGGSLNNLDVWLAKARVTTCTLCGLLGAGLPCYNPKCSYVYHVPCAIKIKCMFFTDRGMYCPQHQPKEIHPMQLSSLVVSRRVYIHRDENSQVACVVHEDSDKHVVRIGGVYVHSIGQLLPHQIDSGNFHNRRNIYPIGMCSTRIYWSMRRPRSRAKYICEILEKDFHPLFRITAIDRDMENVTVTHETCDGAWQTILSRIETLCKDHKLIKLFPKLLRGEDLFGLNESHIVRAVESLPGVDSLRDYVFNFGRLELISEMPLAVNPSGCARSEPKMQTYVKRLHDAGDYSVPFCHRTSFPGVRRLSHLSFSGSEYTNGVCNMDNAVSKQHQSSRSQQYRKLKTEINSNVILGRSRIQGLGLFAARDLEQQTMVIEYVGELIRLEIANKREKHYEAHNRGIYMFRLDDDTVIDATVCGGLARYINHSCQPNCFAEFVNFGGHSHIVIITNRRIKKGEELCYDYNFDFEDRSDKIPCLCRAPNCRKWMN
ncbi:hypothetical protein MN116_005482 [Schistosoma mekongi]|uniref:Histone-lysine N-methyltransferase n=1 Tax=Schistosoma mekongi TaxID=38744 RepID=A0AAE1ZEQ9_SCHME|nr:hypothetical protein MN116_005482 [Schistosoma mekongi]